MTALRSLVWLGKPLPVLQPRAKATAQLYRRARLRAGAQLRS